MGFFPKYAMNFYNSGLENCIDFKSGPVLDTERLSLHMKFQVNPTIRLPESE